MMTELSLNILDIAQNSIKAEASLIQIEVDTDTEKEIITIKISDDGCGMTEDQILNVQDPFFTTRTTRKVGLGIPFFQYAAESTGGSFSIKSTEGRGTSIQAVFILSHIDCMPMGDLNATIYTLIRFNTHVDFLFQYGYNGNQFLLDTRQLKEILGEVPIDTPEVSNYIVDYLKENTLECRKMGN